MVKWILLIMGGALGTVSRYALAGFVTQKAGTAFPWGTVVVNVTGCFVIGFLDIILEKKFLLSPHYRTLLMVGFCGAFTTFSTLMLEVSDLLKQNQFLHAMGNVLISLIVGFIAFKIGAIIAEAL